MLRLDHLFHFLRMTVLAGVFFILTPAGAAAPVQLTQSFHNADIRDVIEAVAKLTGKNFIIDPHVKGEVTLIAPNPMPADTLYQTLLALLRVHGYAAIEGPTATKIVPVNSARDKLPAIRSQESDAWITTVVPLKWLDGTKLVPALRPLVAREGLISAVPGDRHLILTDTRANITRLRQVIARLDQPLGDYDVITLQYADGDHLARVLQGMVPTGVKLSYNPQGNQLIVAGSEAARLQLRALVAQLDQPVAKNGQVEVVYLHYASAKAVAPLLQKLAGSRTFQLAVSSPTKDLGKAVETRDNAIAVTIEADEAMNALVISAQPNLLKALKSVIQQLDVRRAQVLIEAVIVELSADKAAQLGIEWGALGANGVGLLNLSGTLPSLIANQGNPAAQAQAIGRGLNAAVGEQYRSDRGWLAFLRALQSDTQANIISTPSLLTLDNQDASIVVGREVPFQTGSYTTQNAGATPTNPFVTIKRENVGLKLNLRPLINQGDEVQLKLHLELSDVLPKGDAVDLQTSKRAIDTTVQVKDGSVLVLGGLLTERETQVDGKVPLLGDIPGLGLLFRNTDNQRSKVNLMMFIRPVILRDTALSSAVSRQKYQGLYLQQQHMLHQWHPLLKQGARPRLEPLHAQKRPVSPAGQKTSPSLSPIDQTLQDLGL